MTLEELKVLISAEVAPLQKGIKQATSSLNAFQKTAEKLNKRWGGIFTEMTKTVLKFLSAASLIKWGKQALDNASKLEEWQNVVNVAFGKATDDINAWASTLANKFGLIELQAKQMSSTFMAMGSAEGVATDKGIIMAKNLTQLSGDMASFFNTTADIVAEDLQSVYTGTTLALRKYGLVLTEANLNQFALEKNLGKTVEQMNQAEKATLRYNYVMEKMAMTQGDFSRTSGSWANQMRILKQNWIELLGILGDGLRVILAPLLAMLNNLVVAAVRVAQAIAAIFGKKITQNTTNLSTGFEDVGSSIDDATGSAKKFKAQLASFDELDILKEDEDSGSGGLAGLGSGGFDVGDLYDVEEAPAIDGIKLLNEKLEEWNQKLKENYDKMVKAANDWGKQFSDAFLRIRWDLIGEVLANGLDIINGSINAFIDALDLDAFGRKFAEMFNHFFTELNWEELGKTWGNKLKILADVLYGFFDDLDWQKIAVSIETAFQSMFNRIPWEKLGLTVATGLNGITTVIMEWSENFPIRDYVNHIWLAIRTAFENVDWKQLGQAINKLIIQAFEALQDIDVKEITNKIHDFLKGLNLGEIITEFFKTQLDIKGEFWAGIFQIPEGVAKSWVLLGDAMKIVFGAIGGVMGSGVLTNFLLIFNKGFQKIFEMDFNDMSLKGWFGTFSDMLTDTYGEFNGWCDGIIKGIGKVFKSLLPSNWGNLFKGLINGIKSGFGKIVEWISGIFGSLKSLGISGILKNLAGGFKTVFGAIKGFIVENPAVVVVAIVASIVAALVDLYKNNETFRAKVQEAWENIKNIISTAWNSVIKPTFDLIVAIIQNVLVPVIKTIIDAVKFVVEPVATLLLNLWNNVISPVVTWVLELIGKVIEALTNFIEWFSGFIGGIVESIVGFFSWNKVYAEEETNGTIETQKTLWDAFREWLGTLWDTIKAKIEEVWNAIKEWFVTLVTDLKNAGVDAFNTLKDGIGSALGGIKDAFSSAWSFIVGDTTSKFADLVSKVGSAVSKIGSSVSSMLSTIANGISSAWSSINSFVSSAISRLASVVIPHFANGGVLDRPTVGLMGEYAGARTNPEIVTPESKMREVFNESNGEIAALLDRQNKILSEILEKDNSITIGDDVISASAARGNLAYKKRTGRSQFAI